MNFRTGKGLGTRMMTSMAFFVLPVFTVADEPSEKAFQQELPHTDVVIDMIAVSGGTFIMGDADLEDARPVREISVDGFWMSRTEITWDQYEIWTERLDSARRNIFGFPEAPTDSAADAVTRPTPPYTDMSFGMGRGQYPAICMTQHAARMYCEWLTARTGRYYRLPTETEWEYACRAGTKSKWSFGDDVSQLDDYAWYSENSEETSHPVGLKKPNPLGLFDMHGNVAEWVLDQYNPKAYSLLHPEAGGVIRNPLQIPTTLYPRVVRGGGWDSSARKLASSARTASDESWKQQDPQIPQSIWYHTDALSVGFRVVTPFRVPDEQERRSKWDKTAPEQKDPEEI